MENNATIVRHFIETVLNNGDIEATGQYFHEDVIELAPFPGQGPGLSGLKEVLGGLRTVYPDMHWTIGEQVSEGEKVATRFTWTGTHQAEFLGVPASGRRVSVWGVVIDRFVDGKIKDTRLIMDALGLMAQMGAFAPEK